MSCRTPASRPDVWKIEGLDQGEDCRKVVAAARRAGRDMVGCIILGRHENDDKVRQWLTTAAAVPGFIGFAVGRTTFWDPLVNYRAQKITRETAVCADRRFFPDVGGRLRERQETSRWGINWNGMVFQVWARLHESRRSLVNLGKANGGPAMTTTAHLWAIGYDDMERADQVRDEITELGWGRRQGREVPHPRGPLRSSCAIQTAVSR